MDSIDFLNLDAASASRLIGLVVPLLVALLTRRWASDRLKSVLNVLSSAVLGSAVYLMAADGGYDLEGFFNSFLNTLVVSIVSYYGFYKPTGVAGSVAEKTEGFGLGSDRPPAPPLNQSL